MRGSREARTAIVGNARRLLTDAEILLRDERYPTALAIAILTVEEVGKVYLEKWQPEKKSRTYHSQKQSILGSFYLAVAADDALREWTTKMVDLPDDGLQTFAMARVAAGDAEGRREGELMAGEKATTKRESAAKAKSKRTALRAKTKRAVRKRLTPSKVKPLQQSTEPSIEVIKVETVEEPAPGTVVVTEYEEVRVPGEGSSAKKGKQTGLDLPDPEED
jgi:AbiV family abortive infection protein